MPPTARNFRRLHWQLALPLLLLTLMGTTPLAGGEHTVTVLAVGDSYQLGPTGAPGERGGFPRLATLLQRERAAHPGALFLLPGDFLSPSLLSSLFQGRQMVEAFNAVGLDYTAVGNHEFDHGWASFQENLRASRFPWLLSNVTRHGQPLPGTVENALPTVNGVPVGLFALLMPETAQMVQLPAGVEIREPVATARLQVRHLRERGAKLVIALTHLPLEAERELARQVPGIDLMVGGHDHVVVRELIGETLLVEGGMDLEVLLRITLRPGTPKSLEQVTVLPVDATLADDPSLAALVAEYQDRADGMLDRVVGHTATPLDATNATVRALESTAGNLVTDALREAAGAQVGLINGGAIRGNREIPAGPLSKKLLHTLLPFGNLPVTLELTGSELREVLENGLARWQEQRGQFLQLSGVRITARPEAPPGSRLVEVWIGDQPLNTETRYRVATTDYLAQGRNGFTSLAKARVLSPPDPDRPVTRVVEEYLQRRGTVSPRVEGRIRAIP